MVLPGDKKGGVYYGGLLVFHRRRWVFEIFSLYSVCLVWAVFFPFPSWIFLHGVVFFFLLCDGRREGVGRSMR